MTDLYGYTETVSIDDFVRYVNGTRLSQFKDAIGIVKAIRNDAYTDRPISYGVWYGDSESYGDSDRSDLVWAAVTSWRKVAPVAPLDLEKVFTDAAGGPLEVAKAELARLETRVSELREAIAVIEGVINP